ncbi:hypothetical protein [Telmatospirillum sp.]|uniref:hypothetical protein n=1 Tax=Telmatospirillum sp. TaxID=2079197 RepID=UPI002842AA47|nr:hypothetical protein [Telmatospirillum sp.]MDR3435565.1 hypothetical protein [Telmatospirillum sp.]
MLTAQLMSVADEAGRCVIAPMCVTTGWCGSTEEDIPDSEAVPHINGTAKILADESPAVVMGNGSAGVAEVDGERVTRFSGNSTAGSGGASASVPVPALFPAGK